jgi:ABC-type Zn uptake system ZnuABC Zn-binding protein ZnuA
MRRILTAFVSAISALTLLWSSQAAAVAPAPQASGPALRVLAIETFLADIARNVTGDRLKTDALLPLGADPHSFEPTPADVVKVAESNVLIVNGAGFEEFLDELLRNAGGARKVIEASAGLTGRAPRESEEAEEDEADDHHDTRHKHEDGPRHEDGHENEHDDHGHGDEHHPEGHHHEGDPHFWLSPPNVVKYVENIRDGLSEADPDGAAIYASNASAYIAKIEELDRWVSDQVKQIPADRRLLVTNHESFGYYADRYGFRIIGAIVPSFSTGASPSARDMARLVKKIKETGAKAIFLETGSDPRLAGQMAREAGIKVEAELYTHSITGPEGSAPSYIEMIRWNTAAIVNALK